MLKTMEQRETRQDEMRLRQEAITRMRPRLEPPMPVLEKRWRVKDLVNMLSMSRRTVIRRFEKLPGIEFMGDYRGSSKKRRYSIMLVPNSVLEAELARWRRR